MPTGYTATLHDGDQSFPDFVLGCARAFGALITMRDDPSDAAIPDEFMPSDYHPKAVEKARAELLEVQQWSYVTAQARADDDYTKAQERREKCANEVIARRGRYEAMLKQVKAWVPPTDEHLGLREFMVQQITESYRFDDYIPAEPHRVTGDVFRDLACWCPLDMPCHADVLLELANPPAGVGL